MLCSLHLLHSLAAFTDSLSHGLHLKLAWGFCELSSGCLCHSSDSHLACRHHDHLRRASCGFTCTGTCRAPCSICASFAHECCHEWPLCAECWSTSCQRLPGPLIPAGLQILRASSRLPAAYCELLLLLDMNLSDLSMWFKPVSGIPVLSSYELLSVALWPRRTLGSCYLMHGMRHTQYLWDITLH